MPTQDSGPPRRRRSRHRRRRRRRQSRSTRALVTLTAILLPLGLIADLAYVVARAASGLESTRTSLQDARAALDAGKLSDARAELDDALDAALGAASLRRHPGFWVISPLPDSDAVSALIEAAELTARAGMFATDAAVALGVKDGDFTGSLYEEGALRLDALRRATPAIQEVDTLLQEAAGELEEASSPYFGPVESALLQARQQVGDAADTARRGGLLFGALPSLVGSAERRRYLLAFQALGEARATGGLVGYYGVLEAEDGRLELTKSGPISELPNRFPAVDAPDWFAENYGPQSALTQAQQVNVSPNFPVVAEALLEMFEQTRDLSLDGVIAMDPVALSQLMEATGPISVPGSADPVTPEGVTQQLLHDSYLRFERSQDQDAYLGALIDAFWKRIRTGEFDGGALVDGIGNGVRSQHLKMYSRDGEDQAALTGVEADGLFSTAGPNVQMVFNNNYSANKVDYYLHREVRTAVELNAEGDAAVKTDVILHNEAPAGPPSLLLGPATLHSQDPPGQNRMILNVLLPAGGHPQVLRTRGRAREPFVYSDEKHAVVWDSLNLAAGATTELGVEYDLPGAAELSSEGGTFKMTLYPQATVNDDRFRFAVSAPYGFHIVEAGSGEAARSEFSATGVLDEPKTFDLELVPR